MPADDDSPHRPTEPEPEAEPEAEPWGEAEAGSEDESATVAGPTRTSRRKVWLTGGSIVAAVLAMVLVVTLVPPLFSDGEEPAATATRSPSPAASPSMAPTGSPVPATPTPTPSPTRNGQPAADPPAIVRLVDERPLEEDCRHRRQQTCWERGPRNVGSEEYPHSLAADVKADDHFEDWKLVTFLLDRDVEWFTATVGLPEEAPSYAVARFVVVLDDEFHAVSNDLAHGEQAELRVDVSGATRLGLRVEDRSECTQCTWYEAIWGDAQLERA